MSAKSELINKLKHNKKTRESYVRAKINVNLPSQIRALRLRRKMKQEDLASEAEMLQPRISAMERPGATKFNIETLIRLAAAFKVGVVVKFVSFSEMLRWENEFSQDTFDVTNIEEDIEFQSEQQPSPALPDFVQRAGLLSYVEAQSVRGTAASGSAALCMGSQAGGGLTAGAAAKHIAVGSTASAVLHGLPKYEPERVDVRH